MFLIEKQDTMAVIQSKRQMGFTAPDFNLPDVVSGKSLSLNGLKGSKGTAVIFICNHCPYVIHIIRQLVQVGRKFIPQGISFVMISSNDVVKYPADSPERMAEFAREFDFPFPYLYDETQEVAKAYEALCTPDISVFDENLKCVYRGQFDDSRPGSGLAVTGDDFQKALDHLVAGKPIPEEQNPCVGCGIKWK